MGLYAYVPSRRSSFPTGPLTRFCVNQLSHGKGRVALSLFPHLLIIARCQWHKRENVVSYLPERERPRVRRKLQKAYDCDTYEEAKAALESLKPELKLMNQSAVTSLEEGLEETLTLHRLGMLPFLKRSFRTTNCIEPSTA